MISVWGQQTLCSPRSWEEKYSVLQTFANEWMWILCMCSNSWVHKTKKWIHSNVIPCLVFSLSTHTYWEMKAQNGDGHLGFLFFKEYYKVNWRWEVSFLSRFLQSALSDERKNRESLINHRPETRDLHLRDWGPSCSTAGNKPLNKTCSGPLGAATDSTLRAGGQRKENKWCEL